MSGPREARLPDPAKTALRVAVAAVDGALTRIITAPVEPNDPQGNLEIAWRELVGLLALGPEPEYRECPSCGATGMRDATVCGHCWTKLPPAPCLDRRH